MERCWLWSCRFVEEHFTISRHFYWLVGYPKADFVVIRTMMWVVEVMEIVRENHQLKSGVSWRSF